jgi:site-specific recombinase
MNPEKVTAIKACLVPTTRRQFRAFVGMIGWYSNFVARYADRSKAFQGLKDAIIHHLVLAHPIFGKHFILRTDTSNYGVGAVLSHIDELELNVLCALPPQFWTRCT